MPEPEESPTTPWLRTAGVVLFLVSAALPVARCAAPPRAGGSTAFSVVVVTVQADQAYVPWRVIADTLSHGWHEGGFVRAIWSTRAWYPYLLAPLWLLGLLLAPRLRPAARRRLGIGFLGLCVAIAVLEAFYISIEFQGLFVGTAGVVEDVIAWLVVVAILFVRPPGVRATEVAGTVSAQALLGLFHALTFPAYDVLTWSAGQRSLEVLFSGVLAKYRPAFWVAVFALLLAALPAYVPRRQVPQPAR